jgi:hypothetical protein
MLRLLVLGALGYVAYRWFQKRPAGDIESRSDRRLAVAGGPLSENAALQNNPDEPPADNPFVASRPTPA